MDHGIQEHPVIKNMLLYGEARPPTRRRCVRCGSAAEVWSGRGDALCRLCALDTWRFLNDEQRLDLLGCEPLN